MLKPKTVLLLRARILTILFPYTIMIINVLTSIYSFPCFEIRRQIILGLESILRRIWLGVLIC